MISTGFRWTTVRLACVVVALASMPTALVAATITVTTLADVDIDNDGQCSLREAIVAANSDGEYHDCDAGSGADTIVFSVSGTIVLNSDLDEIADTLRVAGPGRDQLVVDGANLYRPFSLDAAGAGLLEVGDLTVYRASSAYGGAFRVAIDDSLTIRNVLISGGEAQFGGGIYADDAGAIEIHDSEITANRGNFGGGGLFVSGSASLFVQDSTIAENFAGPDDGATDSDGGGIYISGTAFEIRRSTISGNGARGHGGGLHVVVSDGLIRNSTVVLNFADTDGDGHSGGGLRVDNVTGETVSFANTIVAENADGSVSADLHSDISLASGSVATLSYNWIGDQSSVESVFPAPTAAGSPNVNGDFVGTPSAPIDPGVAALGDYGGRTRTHYPAASSGVIDQGNCPAAVQDQRRYGNPQTSRRTVDDPSIPNLGDGCDIGSVEHGATFVDGLLFLDDFESGDTSAWSSTVTGS